MKLSSKLTIIGVLLTLFGSTFGMLITGLIFKDPLLGISSFYFVVHIGVIIIMFGYRATKILGENGRLSFKNIIYVFKCFSLPQILITIGGFLLVSAFLSERLSVTVAGMIVVIFLGVNTAAVIIAVIRKIKAIKTTPKTKTLTIKTYCFRCNTATLSAKAIDGHTYCLECAELITRPKKTENALLATRSSTKTISFLRTESFIAKSVLKSF